MSKAHDQGLASKEFLKAKILVQYVTDLVPVLKGLKRYLQIENPPQIVSIDHVIRNIAMFQNSMTEAEKHSPKETAKRINDSIGIMFAESGALDHIASSLNLDIFFTKTLSEIILEGRSLSKLPKTDDYQKNSIKIKKIDLESKVESIKQIIYMAMLRASREDEDIARKVANADRKEEMDMHIKNEEEGEKAARALQEQFDEEYRSKAYAAAAVQIARPAQNYQDEKTNHFVFEALTSEGANAVLLEGGLIIGDKLNNIARFVDSNVPNAKTLSLVLYLASSSTSKDFDFLKLSAEKRQLCQEIEFKKVVNAVINFIKADEDSMFFNREKANAVCNFLNDVVQQDDPHSKVKVQSGDQVVSAAAAAARS